MNPMVKDVWQTLISASKPIALYGTGDGADKILDVFERYGIEVCGVFASEEFVRSRFFRGMKVMSYNDVSALFGDFIVIIAFASSQDDVLEYFYTLSETHQTYAPDVPVVGDTLFDSCFYVKNKSEFDRVRSMLCDEESVYIFDNVINFKLSGDISYLCRAQSNIDKVRQELLSPDEYVTYCDLGAYTGDTIYQLLSGGSSVREIYALEPDPHSFRKLTAFCDANCPGARLYNAGAWSHASRAAFSARGSRSSRIISKDETPTGGELVALDSILDGRRADYIKYDVEGSEYEALVGSAETIKTHSPDLCVSLYHRSEDLFRLPLYIKSLNPDYRFYIRRFKYIPAWDLNLYCKI